MWAYAFILSVVGLMPLLIPVPGPITTKLTYTNGAFMAIQLFWLGTFVCASLLRLSYLKPRFSSRLSLLVLYSAVSLFSVFGPQATVGNIWKALAHASQPAIFLLTFGLAFQFGRLRCDWIIRAFCRGVLLGSLMLALGGIAMTGPSGGASGRFGSAELLHPTVIGFSAALATSLLFVKWQYEHRASLVWRVLFFGSVLLLLLTFSKTSILATFATLTVLVMLGPVGKGSVARRTTLALSVLVTFVVAGLLLWNYLSGQYAAYFADWNALSTISGRLFLWNFAIDRFLASPVLGYGFSAPREILSAESDQLARTLNHVHNDWLNSLLNVGLLGTVPLLLCFALAGYALLRRTARGHAGALATRPAVSVLAIYLVLLFHSFTQAYMTTFGLGFGLVAFATMSSLALDGKLFRRSRNNQVGSSAVHANP